MSKKVAILQSNYIPWKGYFDLINLVDEFVVYDHVQYTKNDWRNRNIIKTKDGKKWLTIPVKHHSLSQRVNETYIADSAWGKKHWTSLKANYSRAEFFKEYKNIFEDIYLQSSDHLLTNINVKFMRAINAIFDITTAIRDDREFTIMTKDKSEKLIEIIKQCHGAEYISGAAAQNYLNESLFNQEGIKVTWMDYSNYKSYRQLFPPFVHGVSILDLIFNEGPEAKKYMKSFNV